jgi:hypothetical protein
MLAMCRRTGIGASAVGCDERARLTRVTLHSGALSGRSICSAAITTIVIVAAKAARANTVAVRRSFG